MSRAALPPGVPVFLKFKGKKVLVAGTGKPAVGVAFRILEGGGKLLFAAEALPAELESFRKSGKLRWLRREPRFRDLAAVALAFPLADTSAANRRLRNLARKRGVMLGGAELDSGNDIELGPVIWRGPLLIGLWLFQAGPWLQRWIWRRLLKQWGEEWTGLFRVTARYAALHRWSRDLKSAEIRQWIRQIPSWIRALRLQNKAKVEREIQRLLKAVRKEG